MSITYPLPRVILVEWLVSPPLMSQILIVQLQLVPRHAVRDTEEDLKVWRFSSRGHGSAIREDAHVKGGKDRSVH